jgi:hypothetical protein
LNPHSNTFSLMRQVQEFSATRLHVGSEKDHTKPYLLGYETVSWYLELSTDNKFVEEQGLELHEF